MCELLGGSLKNKIDITEYLSQFYSHSPQHPHGWGIMRFTDGEIEIIKEPVRANDSLIVKDIISGTKPQKNFLAHIRLATVGSKKYENSHPFTGKDITGRQWTMIHNGTIYSSGKLMKYLNTQVGDTDSERVFLHLLDLINERIEANGDVSIEDRFDVIDKLTIELSRRNKLNLMIFDGEVLYVHKNMKETLSIKQDENGVIISTQPLDEGFEPYPLCKLRAYREGELIHESSEVTTEFIPTLDSISALAALNI